jgi:hypothetical protein
VFPPQIDDFQNINFKSGMGSEFFGKKGEKWTEKPKPRENPMPTRKLM